MKDSRGTKVGCKFTYSELKAAWDKFQNRPKREAMYKYNESAWLQYVYIRDVILLYQGLISEKEFEIANKKEFKQPYEKTIEDMKRQKLLRSNGIYS